MNIWNKIAYVNKKCLPARFGLEIFIENESKETIKNWSYL